MQYFDDGGGSAREQARSKGLRKRERQGEGVRPVPGVAMAAGVVTPWAMECLLLTPALFRMPLSVFGLVYTHQVGWILWLVPVAVAALAVLPIVLGLMFARGGTRWWQVGAGGSACALLAWGAWYTRDSELGWMGAVLLAIPVMPCLVGMATALEPRLPSPVRDYGLGLVLGSLPMLTLIVNYPAFGVVTPACVLVALWRMRRRLRLVTVVRNPRARERKERAGLDVPVAGRGAQGDQRAMPI